MQNQINYQLVDTSNFSRGVSSKVKNNVLCVIICFAVFAAIGALIAL